MAVAIAFSVDAQAGFQQVAATFGALPQHTERAQRRALKKLATWLKRRVLQAASHASAIPQKFFQNAMRYHVTVNPDGLVVWTGTDPIGVHRLGAVTWARTTPGGRPTKGAKVGRKVYPGAWSWGRGKTGPAVMQRTGATRLPIAAVQVHPHEPILERLQALQQEAGRRFETLLRQELNYALTVEAR